MKGKFQYILVLLILTIVYVVYLIVFYNYKDFQVNSYISYLEWENKKIEVTIEKKKDYLAYVKTNAFLDRMAKSSQNRQNPWEEAIFLVNENDIKEYRKLDTDRAIASQPKIPKKTDGMSNREKWIFYIFHVDLRDI